MSRISITALFFLLVAPALSRSVAAEEMIRPWISNPWYWEFQGKPVFLAGGTDDDNLFQWPKEKLIPQFDLLASCGGNYVRNTMSDRNYRDFEIYPYRKLPDGKYDLERWNDEYWERFECFLEETARREIFIQIEVWDRFDYSRENWPPHPYNPKNNVNYTHESSGLAAEYPDHPGKNKQPFFFTVPTLRNNTVVYPCQQRFVDKLLSYTLRYGHVLYCMDNETSGAEEWGRWWAEYIKEKASGAGKEVCVTEMWDDWNLQGKEHRRTFDHPELYDFVDVSQNNQQKKGQNHWDNFQWTRKYLARKPRPMNTVKTYGANKNKFGHSDQDGIERVWRHVLGGAASVRFHRPPSGLGLSSKAQASIRAIRMLEKEVPIWDLEPTTELLGDREENEAYAAAKAGEVYVIFFTKGGRISLDLTKTSGNFSLRWLDLTTAQYKSDPTLREARSRIPLISPDKVPMLAVLKRDSGDGL